jgi:hypothetical protein
VTLLLIFSVARVFDRNQDGFVDAEELFKGLSLLSNSSAKERLSLAFNVVDENGDGFITPKELMQFYVAVYSVLVAMSAKYHTTPQNEVAGLVARTAAEKTREFFKYVQ